MPQNRKNAGLTVLSFAVLNLIGILRHEMWRDEVHAWMLARESSSLVELFQNLRYEGHPSLWHLCLYGLSQLTSNPLIMKIFHWEIGVAIALLIHCYAPFRRTQKILLSLGYFIFYEYSVISRSYSFSVLFLFLFCALYASQALQKSRFYIAILAIALISLANTTAFGLLLSFALALLLAFELWQQRFHQTIGEQIRAWITPAVILFSGWGLSLLQITRPLREHLTAEATRITEGWQVATAAIPDVPIGSLSSEWLSAKLLSPAALLPRNLAFEQQGAAKRLAYTLVQIWKAYVPIPPMGETNFWNQNILVNSERLDISPSLPLGLGLGILLSGGLFVWSVWRLRRSRILQVVYIVGVILLALFSFNFFWWGSQRHHGYLWLLFLACLWLLPTVEKRLGQTQANQPQANQPQANQPQANQPQASRPQSPYERPLSANTAARPIFSKIWRDGFTWLLVLQAWAGCYFYIADFRYSFASGQATAEFIQQNQLDQLTLVAMEDRASAAVSAYLNQPLFYPELDRYGSYWTTYEEPSTPEQLAERIDRLAEESDEDVLLILSKPLEELELPLKSGAIEPIRSFESIVDSDESFHLYRYSKPKSSKVCSPLLA